MPRGNAKQKMLYTVGVEIWPWCIHWDWLQLECRHWRFGEQCRLLSRRRRPWSAQPQTRCEVSTRCHLRGSVHSRTPLSAAESPIDLNVVFMLAMVPGHVAYITARQYCEWWHANLPWDCSVLDTRISFHVSWLLCHEVVVRLDAFEVNSLT